METKEKPEEESKDKEKAKGKKKVERKGKKPHKNKLTSKRWTKYKIEGDNLTKNKFCPRCGPGIFLAQKKDRIYCGRCHYTEFEKNKEDKST